MCVCIYIYIYWSTNKQRLCPFPRLPISHTCRVLSPHPFIPNTTSCVRMHCHNTQNYHPPPTVHALLRLARRS